MRSRLTISKEKAIVLVVVLAFIAVLYLAFIGPFIADYTKIDRMIDSTSDLYLRYNKLSRGRQDYHSALEKLQSQNIDETYLFRYKSEAIAIAKIQSKLTEKLRAAGAIINSVIHQAQMQNDFPVFSVSYKVRIRSDSNRLQQILFNIESSQPTFYIKSLIVTAQTWKKQSKYEEVPVDIDIEVYAFYEVNNG